jgi:hypothetical protein
MRLLNAFDSLKQASLHNVHVSGMICTRNVCIHTYVFYSPVPSAQSCARPVCTWACLSVEKHLEGSSRHHAKSIYVCMRVFL